ncbi:MAG: hypothetical protein HY985_12245 [Magnetospirillum sp.]|nr:hypothetical protein [Magnetospirillum sp.]
MPTTDKSLLNLLRATAESRQTKRLEAEVVRTVGEMLGLPEAALVEAIDRLVQAKALRLSFGGTVEIAEAAPTRQGGIVAGGDIIAGGNISIAVGDRATAGDHAIGAEARVLGHLAAAKTALADDPNPEAQALKQAADDLAELAKAPKAPGTGERLKTIGGTIDKALTLPGKVATAAEAVKKAYDLVAPWVGG